MTHGDAPRYSAVSIRGEGWGFVSNQGFYGAHSLAMDGKGRVTVPARHRESLLAAGGRLTVTKHPDGCLLVLPPESREKFVAEVEALPHDARAWRRIFLGFMTEVEIDSGSRMLIDPVLRDWAGLRHDALLVGLGSYFELWDAGRHAAREAADLAHPGGLPESLRGFSF